MISLRVRRGRDFALLHLRGNGGPQPQAPTYGRRAIKALLQRDRRRQLVGAIPTTFQRETRRSKRAPRSKRSKWRGRGIAGWAPPPRISAALGPAAAAGTSGARSAAARHCEAASATGAGRSSRKRGSHRYEWAGRINCAALCLGFSVIVVVGLYWHWLL